MSTLRLWKETDMSPCFLLISDLYRKLFSTLNIILLLDDGDLPPLVKEIPLPKEASSNLTAEFSNGRLHLRW